MRHAGTQTIETERLLLRPLTPEDAPMMYANWANDPDVTRWLRWEPHKNVDEPVGHRAVGHALDAKAARGRGAGDIRQGGVGNADFALFGL